MVTDSVTLKRDVALNCLLFIFPDAVIVATPAFMPVAIPLSITWLLDIVATDVLSLDQYKYLLLVTSYVVPSENLAVAVYCLVRRSVIELSGGGTCRSVMTAARIVMFADDV